MQQLLKRVAQRQRLILLGSRFFRFWVGASLVYLILLLVSRLLGVIPPWFTPITLAVVPLVALMLALIVAPRANPDDAARLLDRHLNTKDLFLTASSIDHSLGQYQSVVLAQATERAIGVKPSQVVRYEWQRSGLMAGGSLAVLALAVWTLPQLDPFGRQKARDQVTQQQQHLLELNKATTFRAALLEKKTTGEHTEQVNAAVENLKKAFQAADPADKVGTWKQLNEQQKTLGQMWKQLGEDKLKDALQRSASNQDFGMRDPAKMQAIKSDLEKNDLGTANKELRELTELAQQLAAAKDPVAREKMRQELANRLKDLREALAQQMDSMPVDAAMQRAMEQLQMANQQGMSDKALQGLGESLKLTQEEMRQLAMAARDMRTIEDALKTLQLAKQSHGLNPLNGAQCKGFGDLNQYALLYASQYHGGNGMNGLNGDPNGQPGSGLGPGQGVGARPHGDETAQTGFDQKKDLSQLQPGKMLMEWKTHELGEAGQAQSDYLRAVADVRQQASEAVLQEQIPPGYHSAIKSYFKTLSDDLPKPTQP